PRSMRRFSMFKTGTALFRIVPCETEIEPQMNADQTQMEKGGGMEHWRDGGLLSELPTTPSLHYSRTPPSSPSAAFKNPCSSVAAYFRNAPLPVQEMQFTGRA